MHTLTNIYELFSCTFVLVILYYPVTELRLYSQGKLTGKIQRKGEKTSQPQSPWALYTKKISGTLNSKTFLELIPVLD